jgi:predicted ATPase with chaperone activity
MRDKIVFVARTVADYEESRHIRIKDVNEAVDLMGLKQEFFRNLERR